MAAQPETGGPTSPPFEVAGRQPTPRFRPSVTESRGRQAHPGRGAGVECSTFARGQWSARCPDSYQWSRRIPGVLRRSRRPPGRICRSAQARHLRPPIRGEVEFDSRAHRTRLVGVIRRRANLAPEARDPIAYDHGAVEACGLVVQGGCDGGEPAPCAPGRVVDDGVGASIEFTAIACRRDVLPGRRRTRRVQSSKRAGAGRRGRASSASVAASSIDWIRGRTRLHRRRSQGRPMIDSLSGSPPMTRTSRPVQISSGSNLCRQRRAFGSMRQEFEAGE